MTKLLALLAACSLSSVAPLYADNAEGAAIKAVESLGGDVVHQDNDPANPVVHVDMGAQAKDADLKILAAFKRLKEVVLQGSQVTDAGMKTVGTLKGLQELDLGETAVTDAGLKQLGSLKSLQTLDLYKTSVTDAGLKSLTGLKALKSLNLNGTSVTDDGVAALQKALPNCDISHNK